MFNPIIPFFRQVPTWWERHGIHFDTAKQIINGYIDTYEPEFLVEAEPGMAQGLGFDPKRVISLSDILVRSNDRERKGIGLSTFDLYKELYYKEFQFERRHKHDIVQITAEDPAFNNFCACVFGDFPNSNPLDYFAQTFKKVFAPAEIILNANNLANLYRTGAVSVLVLGHQKIEVNYNNQRNMTIFVMNALEPRDLIDFWNLRTLQSDIVAVPFQWIKELSVFCKAIIKEAHQPMMGNPNGIMLNANVMFSRSLPPDEIESIYNEFIMVDSPGANSRQDWYPAIWRQNRNDLRWSSRTTLTAVDKTFDVQYSKDEPDVRFDSVYPEFAEKYGNKNRWVNVIKLKDWSGERQLATAIPTEYRNPKFSPFYRGEVFIPTTEGFVMFPRFRDLQHYWKLSDGITAIAGWLKTFKIVVAPSDAGKATQQIIQRLGTFGDMRSIANADVIKLLNKISRSPMTKSMKSNEFINKVNKAVKGDIWLADAAETLIKRNAVELGIELKCPNCSSWSWYSLKQMDYIVHCSLCLQEFSFPIFDPSGTNSSRWAYRLIGPFALPDYARGGYAAALAIRFFSNIAGHMESNVTWSSGQELTFPSGKKIEADFILWYQRTHTFGNDHPTQILFGEAKSFGREGSMNPLDIARRAKKEDVFQDEDTSRLKNLAEEFPGSILVFATMKKSEDLTKDELKRLRKLAEWGRHYLRESRRTRAPLVVLTGTELFAGYLLRTAWEEKGGRHKEIISRGYVELDQLETLADLTQQLYLGMPPYQEWSNEKWKARKARQEKRKH